MYLHCSLSVCGLLDNRSALGCVLRSLADLCSVLPLCSGLAASQSPNILYPNHTFPMHRSDKRLNIYLLSLPFIYLCICSHCLPSLVSPVNTMCSRHNYVCLHSTHIFGLKTVVGHNESASYEINRHSVWQGVPVVALVMAVPSALCGVIVPKVTPLLSTAVTRRQTQTCCGLKKEGKRKEKACVLDRMWKIELLLNPQKEILFFLPIQGYSYCIKHSKNWTEKDIVNNLIRKEKNKTKHKSKNMKFSSSVWILNVLSEWIWGIISLIVS